MCVPPTTTTRAPGVMTMTPVSPLALDGTVLRSGFVFGFPWPDELLSMNDRTHWRVRHERTAEWRAVTGWHALKAKRDNGLTLPLEPSIVRCYFVGARQRDPMNLMASQKVCIDSCQAMGFWPDDSAKWVTSEEPVICKATKQTGSRMVWVHIRPR